MVGPEGKSSAVTPTGAVVTVDGSAPAKGDKADKGDKGDKGDKADKADKGEKGEGSTDAGTMAAAAAAITAAALVARLRTPRPLVAKTLTVMRRYLPLHSF